MPTLVMLVHGLGADESIFWGSTPTALRSHSALQKYEIRFWGYQTSKGPIGPIRSLALRIGIGAKTQTLEQLGQHLWSDLFYKIQEGQFQTVKLIGHSMGGLVVASAIGYGLERGKEKDKDVAGRITAIAFVATPLGGANLAQAAHRFNKLIGENIHVKDLQPNSASRKTIVTRFINHAVINHKVPLTVFRASADSVVSQTELVEPLESVPYDLDVMNGEHSDCIQNLEVEAIDNPKGLNLLKLVTWINSTPSSYKNQHLESGLLSLEELKIALESVSEADRLMLGCIRGQSPGSQIRNDLPTIYDYIQTGALSSHPSAATEFIKNTHSKSSQGGSDISKTLKPDLVVECGPVEADRISYLRFRTPREILLEVKNSALLWPCSCELSDFERQSTDKQLSRKDCDIHSSQKGEQIHKLFCEGLVDIQYDGLSFLWQKSRYLWPPSIDALNFIEDLRREEATSFNGQSVLDLGCGCGILGIWYAQQNSAISKAHFSDWLISPLLFSAINSSRQAAVRDVQRFFWLGLDTSWHQPNANLAQIDVLLCNPPYLPFLEGHQDVLSDSTVAGTELLEGVIRQASLKAKRTYVSFSDMALPEANRAAADAGVTLAELGDENGHMVPFRVVHSFAYPKYLRKLIDERGLVIRESESFPLWHRVRSYRVFGGGAN